MGKGRLGNIEPFIQAVEGRDKLIHERGVFRLDFLVHGFFELELHARIAHEAQCRRTCEDVEDNCHLRHSFVLIMEGAAERESRQGPCNKRVPTEKEGNQCHRQQDCESQNHAVAERFLHW